MWGVDDDIRDMLKEVKALLEDYKGNKNEVAQKAEEAIHQIKEIIFGE